MGIVMRVIPVKSINTRAKAPENFVAFSEEEYRCCVLEAALGITARLAENKPIVLIAGPSGSGKTGSAHRLKAELARLGFTARIISMDNYFLPIKGSLEGVDLESPKRLDKAFFNEQTEKILRGERITLPIFDFTNQERKEGAEYKRGEGEIVIFEGIHALNPDVTGSLSENASKVYVSVRTRIKGGASQAVHPSMIRLSRRLVRDKLFRGRPLLQTFKFFEKVERGEKLYIMPYKKYADFDIDTFLPYEPCVYKKHILAELKETSDENPLAGDFIMFLEELEDIFDEFVPSWSLVREFIGGSSIME